MAGKQASDLPRKSLTKLAGTWRAYWRVLVPLRATTSENVCLDFLRSPREKPATPLLRSSRVLSIHNSGLSPFIIHTGHSLNIKVLSCKHEGLLYLTHCFSLHHSAHSGACWHGWGIFFNVSYY